MQMDLDITAHNPAECTDEIVNLARVGAANRVGDTDTVHANLVDSLVNRQEIDEIGTEGVFRRETNFDT